MTEGFQVKRCECGHTIGDHQSSGNSFPNPPRYGVCLNCDCQVFRLVPKPKDLADPTTVIVTDGSPEAEASVMRSRIQAAAQRVPKPKEET